MPYEITLKNIYIFTFYIERIGKKTCESIFNNHEMYEQQLEKIIQVSKLARVGGWRRFQ